MTSQTSNPTAVRFWTAAIVLYGIAATIYVIYETVASRGLTGYIVARQIEWFGGSSFTIAFCLALAIFTVVPLIPAIFLGVTFIPSLGDALWSLMFKAPSSRTLPAKAQPKPVQSGFTWPGIFKFMAVMFGLTGAVAGVLYFINLRDQSLGVYKLDLDQPQASLPDRIGFIQVTGHLAQSQALAYHDNDSVHLVAPVTSAQWNPGSPLRYLVHYHQLGTSSSQLSPPREFRNSGPATFGGHLEGKLPVFIERAYSKKGLKLDPDYKVIEWQQLYAGQIPRSDTHLVALIIGGFISVSLSVLLIIFKLKQPA